MNCAPLKVLAVDDHPGNLLVLEGVLRDMDVELIQARSGQHALELAATHEPGLVLLDVRMPGMDGLQTAAQLRRQLAAKGVPIIFITAFDEAEEQVAKGYALGAVDFLFKPIVPAVLQAKVAVFAELHRKTEAARIQQMMLHEAQTREYERDRAEARARWEAEQLRSEIELQRRIAEERQLHATILHAVADAVVAVDSANRILFLNRAAEALIGWDGEAAVGRRLQEVVVLLDPVRRVAVTPAAGTRDAILQRKDGSERVVIPTATATQGASMAEHGTVWVLRDITVQRRMEHDLQNQQRLESLGLLAGGIAHDFNNMLGMIMAGSSLAREQLGKKSEVDQRLNEIEEVCERATELTRQLLTFARGGAPVRKPCRPQQLVKDAVEFSLRGSSTKPVFEVANSLWSVKVDVGQVTQALSNVVLNAREAMDGDGTLKIYANNVRVADGDPIALQPGPYVEIAIRDSGRGMTAETLEHIFDPYFTTKDHGTGLGLAVAYSVLQRHGGLLRAESQLGAGSSFFIYLPAEETGPQVESEPTVPRKVRAATGRVLVMDDEPRLRDLLADCLVALGCRVETATDGAEAIAAYRQAMQKGQPFDVVILDLTVRGGMGGVETVTHLRELNPEVQAIASSGYADDPVMSNFGRYGFVAALNKPFRFAMLARTVRNIVGAESTNERAVATLEASGADSH